MRKIIFFALTVWAGIVLCPFRSWSQNVTLKWGKAVGRPLNGASCNQHGIVVDKHNNTYSAGHLASYPAGPVDFGSGIVVTSSLQDAFIAKHDAQGNCIRVNLYPSAGTFPNARSSFWNLFSGADNHLYAMGQLQGSLGIAPGDTVRAPSGMLFFAKIDTTGNFVWLKYFEQLAGTGSGATLQALAADSQGNVYISGYFSGTVDFDPDPVKTEPIASYNTGSNYDMFVCKLDKDGDFIWVKHMGGVAAASMVIATMCVLDTRGDNLYVNGYFNDEVDFNPAGGNLLTTDGVADVFTLKMTSGGDLVWVKQFEGSGTKPDNGNGVAVDANGGVAVTGSFNGTITFATGTSFTVPATGSDNRDMFIARLDSAGNLTWAKHLGGTGLISPGHITTDDFGYIYTSGYFMDGNVDFDPGPDPYILSAVSANTFVSKLDQNGDFLYAFQLEGNNNQSRGIAVSPGNVFLSGDFRDTIDLDPTSAKSEQTNQGYSNAGFMYFANYRDCPDLDTLPAIRGNDTVCAGGSYVFSVPPVPGAVSYTWELPAGWNGASRGDSIAVTAGIVGGDIKVIANGVCDSSTGQIFSVYVNLLSVSVTLNGDTLTTDNAGNYTSWQWFLNGTAISQATGSSHIAVENGDYTVVVTDRYGCTDTSAIQPVTHIPESVPGLTSAAIIRIYPNPATHTVYIHAAIPVSVRLSTIEGKTVAQQIIPGGVRTAFDLSDLATGVYLLNIADESGRLIRVEKLVRTAE